jgi:6-phosphofructokinase
VQAAIRATNVETSCNLSNGIEIVKLMRRNSGFIAANNATLALEGVDLCLNYSKNSYAK